MFYPEWPVQLGKEKMEALRRKRNTELIKDNL